MQIALICGLSANPAHQGHIVLISGAIQALGQRGHTVAETLLIPVYRRNPTGAREKEWLPQTFEHRLQLCELAAVAIMERIASDSGPVWASRIEERLAKDREEPNYTAETLAALRAELPSANALALLISSEFVSGDRPEFAQWHRVERIVELATLVICPRPGYPPNTRYLEQLIAQGARILYLEEVQPPPISSSGIRERLAGGEDPHTLAKLGLLPNAIAEYLHRHNFLQKESTD